MAAATGTAGTRRTAPTSPRRAAGQDTTSSQPKRQKSSEPDIPSSVRADRRPRQQTQTQTTAQKVAEPDIPQSVRAKPQNSNARQNQGTSRTQAARQEYEARSQGIRNTSTNTNGKTTATRTNASTQKNNGNPQRRTQSNTGYQNTGPAGRQRGSQVQGNGGGQSTKNGNKKKSNPNQNKGGSSNRSKKPPTRRPKPKRPGLWAWLISLLATGGLIWFIWELMRIDILPTGMLFLIIAILGIIMCLFVIVWLFHTRRLVPKVLMGVLVVLVGLGGLIGGHYLQDTDKMFSQITNLTDKQANTMTVFAMQESKIEVPKQLNASTVVGIDPSEDPTGTEGAIEKLKQQGANFQTQTYENCFALVDALYNHEVDAIIFPENVHGILYEEANDDNKYNALTTFTNVVDQYVYYSDRDQTTINQANPVQNIMVDPFTVMVSGNDSYGSINQVTRSDVNMLVTVNPKTAQVLILSIPRDAYLPISCKKNPTACSAVSGQFDKLTHSGLYGVAATESTLEDAFDVEINYYARINFSSLINIVDAIGGIDVEVEPGLEVDRFYANGTEGVHAGINHLNGERALAFVRERHAYVDGDNQRVRNQQIALKALLKALLSPKMVVNYPEVMTALSTAFDTNMTSKEIKSLLTLELSRFPNWNIQLYSMPGEPAMAYSPAAQTTLSVVYLGEAEVEFAKGLIDDVIDGKTLDPTTFPASTAGTANFVPYLPGTSSNYNLQNVDGYYGEDEESVDYGYGYGTTPNYGYTGQTPNYGYTGQTPNYGYERGEISQDELTPPDPVDPLTPANPTLVSPSIEPAVSEEFNEPTPVVPSITPSTPSIEPQVPVEEPSVTVPQGGSDPYNPYGSYDFNRSSNQAPVLDDPYGVRTPTQQ